MEWSRGAIYHRSIATMVASRLAPWSENLIRSPTRSPARNVAGAARKLVVRGAGAPGSPRGSGRLVEVLRTEWSHEAEEIVRGTKHRHPLNAIVSSRRSGVEPHAREVREQRKRP